jgi:hypothetical protein
MYCFRWLNIGDPAAQVGVDFDAFDVLLVKSNWEWGLDLAVRSTLNKVHTGCVVGRGPHGVVQLFIREGVWGSTHPRSFVLTHVPTPSSRRPGDPQLPTC